jgi:hypothetical protein
MSITIDSKIYNDFKTLVWLSKDFQTSHLWKRWNILITDPQAAKVCDKESIKIVVLNPEFSFSIWRTTLNEITAATKNNVYIFSPQSMLAELQTEGFNYKYLFEIEKLHESFPYIGGPLHSADLPKIIVSIAFILNMNRIAWSISAESYPNSLLADWATACCESETPNIVTLPLDASDSVIPKVWLFQNYFEGTDPVENVKLYRSLKENLDCDFIDKILLFTENIITHSKLQTIECKTTSFNNMFDNAMKQVPCGDFIIFSRAGVTFNETLSHLWEVNLENRLLLTLLKWKSLDPPIIFDPVSNSQDSWIVSRNNLPHLLGKLDVPVEHLVSHKIVANVASELGFTVVNPACSIKTAKYYIYDAAPCDIIHQPSSEVIPSYISYKSLIKSGMDTKMEAYVQKKPMIVIPIVPEIKNRFNQWCHPNDCFREMIVQWEEMGLVLIKRTTEALYCWWGDCDEVLLYDRAIHRWWNSIPVPPYKLALFGNCQPPGPSEDLPRQSIWGFWARRPQILEKVYLSGKNTKGYYEREINSLFIGKVENKVQQDARTAVDWSTSVDLFSMPIESPIKPYPFTQEEYLDKLCSAKFGLCLPGFGRKCNREIEYFACGTVLIVTPNVDIEHYLCPPIEGIHYLRAETPEEVQTIVRTTSPEKWTMMSNMCRKWWKENASAAGFFNLTQSRINAMLPASH